MRFFALFFVFFLVFCGYSQDDVFDLENEEYKTIAICSEVIRLEAQRIRHQEGSYGNMKYKIDVFIESIIGDYIKIYNDGYRIEGNDLFDMKIHVKMCTRPYMSHDINVKNALELMVNGSYSIRRPLFNQVHHYLLNTTYKRYKTKYKECISICESFERGSISGSEADCIKVNKLLNNILQFKIKN